MPLKIITGLDELRSLVSQEIGVSDWMAIEQPRISAFAEVAEDRQWIHIDPARARAEFPLGNTIAHGFLSLALISHLVRQAVRIDAGVVRTLNYGLNRVRFPAPVPCDSRIRGRCSLAGLEEIEGGVQLCWSVIVEVEGGVKPAVVAEWLVRYYQG